MIVYYLTVTCVLVIKQLLYDITNTLLKDDISDTIKIIALRSRD